MLTTLLLRIRLRCKSGRRRSNVRYFRRTSSFVLEFSSIGNGGVSASERIRISFAMISISPVAKFLLIPPARSATSPVIATTYSLLNFSAFAKLSLPHLSSSKITCKIPLRSRRSTKIIPPLLRLFCTHPITVTVSLTFLLLTSVHLWVLCNPFIDSAIIASYIVSSRKLCVTIPSLYTNNA